ncbi:hypothetical protein PAE9249_03755 [Paenibacillus sp. CECT 9249]|nr:hypothetical protein PAE9249_03755 [Paenibacillus sp. CECT 9249]
MSGVRIVKKDYTVLLRADGTMAELSDRPNPTANWISSHSSSRFGAPFVNGSQLNETFVQCKEAHIWPVRPTIWEACKHRIPFPGRPEEEASRENTAEDERSVSELYRFASKSGRTSVSYRFADDHIEMTAMLPDECGPRAGMELDFHFIDMPTGDHWTNQVALNTIYTDERQQYAYFIFQRPSGGFLCLAVDGPFAAWRAKYNNSGHKMTGMQLLSLADDLLITDERKLNRVHTMRIKIAFAETLEQAYLNICKLLGIGMAQFAVSGGIRQSVVPIRVVGHADRLRIFDPEGKSEEAEFAGDAHSLALNKIGEYRLSAISPNGRVHVSRMLCHDAWDKQFDLINRFYSKYFQLESGAFARVIWKDTLSPKQGRTFGGEAFGDAEEQVSCRTGEFGGFAGWAILKNLLWFGSKSEFHALFRDSVDRYIRGWALNENRPDRPNYGTISKKPVSMFGINYSAYHLFQEYNYPQYETWLIGQLIDYYELSGDRNILNDLIGLGKHYIADHIDPATGMAVCQNERYGEKVDYTTVDVPLVHLTKLGKLLQREGHPDSDLFLQAALRMAYHLSGRGLEFPTEGDPCTEEASMACTALSLLYAYHELEANETFLRQGADLLEFHDALEMKGFDCRMTGSTLRYWETQYETRDWGPSINAGHGWAIWTAEAKLLLFLATAEMKWMVEACNAFVANMRKVEENGGMTCSFAPDMIPATPHMPYERSESEEPDLLATSIPLANGYPAKTYSASGNYYLIKAAEYWNRISGLKMEEGIAINGRYTADGIFESLGDRFDILGLSRTPHVPLYVRVRPGRILTIMFESKDREVQITGGTIVDSGPSKIVVLPDSDVLTIQ